VIRTDPAAGNGIAMPHKRPVAHSNSRGDLRIGPDIKMARNYRAILQSDLKGF
jgi:hypothetical protein